MKKRSILSGLAPVLLVLALLVPGQGEAQIKKGQRFSGSGKCGQCHESSEFEGGNKHKPFGDDKCLDCHKPHGLVGVLRLKAERENSASNATTATNSGCRSPCCTSPPARDAAPPATTPRCDHAACSRTRPGPVPELS